MIIETSRQLEDLVSERFELGEERVRISDLSIVPNKIEGIDLRCVDFDRVDLRGKVFKECDLRGAHFFQTSKLENSQIIDCPTRGSNIKPLLAASSCFLME